MTYSIREDAASYLTMMLSDTKLRSFFCRIFSAQQLTDPPLCLEPSSRSYFCSSEPAVKSNSSAGYHECEFWRQSGHVGLVLNQSITQSSWKW